MCLFPEKSLSFWNERFPLDGYFLEVKSPKQIKSTYISNVGTILLAVKLYL